MLKDIVSTHKSAFAPGASTELRAQRNLVRRVVMQNGNLVGNARSDTKGVSARVYKNGLYGFASAAELSEAAVKKALEKATYNAAFLDSHAGRGKGALPFIQSGVRPADEDMNDVPQKTYIDFLRAVDNYIQKKYPKLLSRSVVSACDSMEKLICTSDGYASHIIAPRGYVYTMLTAEGKDKAPVELYEVFGGRGTFDRSFSKPELLFDTIDRLHERLMHKAEGVHAEAGNKLCILGGILSGMLAHEAVGHTVEADLVLAGSVAQHLLNKPVASPLVSMVDFAHTALGETAPLPVYVDDEGVAAEDALLIQEGILRGYMVNREMGERLKMAPQGNARAYMFSDEPLIRMRNTTVMPGTSTLDDMISSVDDGYYLLNSGNGQADATGEFMFGITMGYEIKNGKLGRALKDTTVSGVAFDMLKTVDMVGDTVTWSSSGYCGKKQRMPVGMGGPALRCRITIGGR
ncbi:MAG: TldD/PmbA family protein [Eubacteriales bacterium]|nr:TldD/PmbA family protein [Eubacteriales bacterium]MDD4710899.1 TldD/PmbA family protein [Eubacteriales bacterium]NLO15370.1 TldD/PmbA family protein [Clostridiales bacterium]